MSLYHICHTIFSLYGLCDFCFATPGFEGTHLAYGLSQTLSGGPEVYPLLLLVFYKLIVLSKERAVAYMLS